MENKEAITTENTVIDDAVTTEPTAQEIQADTQAEPIKKTYQRKSPNYFPAFTENFNALVRRSGKNLQQIAEETGIRGPSLSRYKTGARFYPETEEAAKLAVYFNVSIDYLLGVNHVEETVNKLLCSPEAMEVAACFDMASEDDKMVTRAVLRKYKDLVK